MGLVHEVHESSRSADEDIAAFLQLISLVTHRSATIHHTGAKHRAIAQSASLVEDLGRKLPSGRNNQHQRFGTDGIGPRIKARGQVRTRGSQLSRLSHQLRKNGDQKCGRLSRAYFGSDAAHWSKLHLLTGLRNCNQVMVRQNSRDGVRLDGSREVVAAQTDVLHHDGVEAGVLEL